MRSAADSLRQSIELAVAAEHLGADGAYFRVHHFARQLGSIEIEQCARCGGRLQVIASIAEPELIERILAHRRERGEEATPIASLGARARPQSSLF